MKTEKEIKENLKSAEKTLKETSKRFDRYDNVDDMHYIDVLEDRISTLKWILE